MTSSSYIDRLAALDACGPALDWLREQDYPDLASAWAACSRGDWMLWLAGRTAGPPGSDSRRPLVLAACACARTALYVYEERFPEDLRPRRAVEVAEAWARGEATLDDVREAARGARAAATEAAAASAAASAAATEAAAASAAASADAAAAATTAVAGYAAFAVTADVVAGYAAFAAAAATTATYSAARDRVLAEMADIVRAHYPAPPLLENA